MSKSVKKTVCCMRVLVVSKFLRLLSKILVLVVTELAVSGTQCTKSSTQSCIVLNIFLPLAIDCNFKIVVLFYDNGEKQLSFLVYIQNYLLHTKVLPRPNICAPVFHFCMLLFHLVDFFLRPCNVLQSCKETIFG